MPRFLLLLSPAMPGDDLSPTQLGARTVRFMAWIADGARRGVIESGARVLERWAVVTRHGGVTTTSEDGLGDRIAGYFVVEAGDLEDAKVLARACPGADPGAIRILELDPEAVVVTSSPLRARV